MKITPAWLASTEHCPDGRAFGEAMLPLQGLELEQCWPLMERPDWIIALAVKSGFVHYDLARAIVGQELGEHAAALRDQETLDALQLIFNTRARDAIALRDEIAAQAYAAVSVKRDVALGHRLNAAAQLVTADLAQAKHDMDLALTRLQGVAFGLGLSMGQAAAAAAIKVAMFDVLERVRSSHVRK